LNSSLASSFGISGSLLLLKTLGLGSSLDLLGVLRQGTHIFLEFHGSLSLTHIAIIISLSELIIQDLDE